MKILLFFQKFSIWFRALLQELVNNMISVILLSIYYLMLWHFPQTIDLLLILNQSNTFLMEVPLYFILLTILAFLVWNTPKYLYYHNYKKISFKNLIGYVPNEHYEEQDNNENNSYVYLTKIHLRKVIPRILGVMLLLISAIGILHAMELFELKNTYTQLLSPGRSLLFYTLFLLIITEFRIYARFKKKLIRFPKTKYFIYFVLVTLLFLIVSLGTLNTQTERDLGNLFIANVALTVFFFIIAFNSRILLLRFPLQWFYGSVLISGLLILLFFLILNFIPDAAAFINPLSIVLIGLISLFMLSFLILLLGKKIKVPLFSLTFLCCLFLAVSFMDSKRFSHYELSRKTTQIDRIPMEQYMYHWISQRKRSIEAHPEKFPVILASSEGGGSRAGLWAFLVHSYLYEKSEGAYFKDHLLSLTGASGGSAGNSMFFAEAQHAAEQAETDISFKTDESHVVDFNYKASIVYQNNYLSTSLLALMGRDFFKTITNLFQFQDRGKLLEGQWASSFHKTFHEKEPVSLLEREFLSYYDVVNKISQDSTYKLPPLLMINTTHTQTGRYNTISPVNFSHLPVFSGIDDFLNILQNTYPSQSIALATAMRINASFPYVTPVGAISKVDGNGNKIVAQYADAGYYDNIGGTITKSTAALFEKIVSIHFPELKEKIKMVNLVIVNEKKTTMQPTQTQLLAPLITLSNVREGHTQESMEKLGNQHVVSLKKTAIKPLRFMTKRNGDFEKDSLIAPILPLGRYLSTIVIYSMEARLEEVQPRLDAILNGG